MQLALLLPYIDFLVQSAFLNHDKSTIKEGIAYDLVYFPINLADLYLIQRTGKYMDFKKKINRYAVCAAALIYT